MKNSTNLLVAAGSVVTIGLAALPLYNISATTGRVSVSGNTEIYVQVLPAISMTIEGTHDDHAGCGKVSRYTDALGNSSGVVDTYDEISNNNTSCSKITMLPNSFDTSSSRVNVYTNNTAGYKLSVSAAGSTDLTHVEDRNYTIPTGSLTSEAGGQGKWAYKTDGGIVNDWSEMHANPTVIRTRGTKTSGGEETNITYGVSTAPDQASGTYTTTLVYTATTLDDGVVNNPFESCGSTAGDTCEVAGVTYKRQVDGQLWSTTAAAGTSSSEEDLVCPENTHLPTGADFYDILMAYGATTTTENTWPYGLKLEDSTKISQLKSDMGFTSGFMDMYATSTVASTGHNWALAFFGNSYAGFDDAGGTGAVPLKGVCVANE